MSKHEETAVNDAELQTQKQSQIKILIALGKEKGFLTFAEVSDNLPDVIDSEQIEDIVTMIQAMGIPVYEDAPDEEQQLFSEPSVVASAEEEEDAAEEAAAAIASSDDQFGRTTDPVRMYMREMGSVELLDREGEIRIAKRIEEGLNEAMFALTQYPETVAIMLEAYADAVAGNRRLAEVVTGFFDPEVEALLQAGNPIPMPITKAERDKEKEEN
ncbi:MAG: RNA polymerase sigma factor region1.1 domain-containing protein, partial [Polycyclovorans sp.]